MRHYIMILVSLLVVLTTNAQEQRKFSPEKFDAEMEEFITQKANLSQQEAAKLFPLFRDMHKKQRELFKRMRNLSKDKPADDAACAEVIRECDKCNLELKQLEQNYHQKMMQVVSPSKLYDVIKAENHFHRKMMKGWRGGHHKGAKDWPKDKRR